MTTTSLCTQSNASNWGSLLDEDMPRMSFAPLVPSRASPASLPPTSLEPSKLLRTNIHPDIAAPLPSLSQQKSLVPIEQRLSEVPQQNMRPTTSQKTPQLDLENRNREKSPSTNIISTICPKIQNQQPKVGVQQLAHGPTPEFLRELKTSFVKLMTGLQGFPGEVIVQTEFGRIILRKVNSQFVTSDDNAESFSQKEVLSQLLPGSQTVGSHAFFTNILTTLPMDIGYLVGIKGRTDRAMWEQTAAESSIVYEISCHNEAIAGYNPFTIEINGKTFDTRIKTRYDFGAVNVHGILRHWDFRMVAFGFGDDEQNEKLYGDFMRAIKYSLYIP